MTNPAFTLDDINNLLLDAVEQDASDIVLKHLSPPVMKLQGQWMRIDTYPHLTISDLQSILQIILNDDKYQEFILKKEADFQLSTDEHRFRVNAALQRNGIFLTFRPIPKEPPKLQDLQLIEHDRLMPKLQELIELPRGLILVTGPTGSGKSTTLAAMINHLNHKHHRHIITIEDPIEFLHADHKCILEQREVGNDTLGFSNALRGVLRQTPDVILVGEMRDPETIEAAITAAETGHLVISTVHTNNAPSSISRILDVMPADKHNQIRTQLAATLKAVITQLLVPRKDGASRQVIMEMMIMDQTLSNLVGSSSQSIEKYYDQMHASAASGNTLMDRQLAVAVKQGIITAASAESRVITKNRYEEAMNNVPVRTMNSEQKANAWTR